MLLIYNLLYALLTPIIYPLALVRSRKRGGFSLRRRLFPPIRLKERPVWVHCSSIGEVNSVKPLVERLMERGRRVFLTTLTDYGAERAKRVFPSVEVCVLPPDLIPLMKRFVRRVKPERVLIYETEIWPSLLSVLKGMGVPVFFISGKISERSFRRYLMVKRFLKPLVGDTRFLARSDADAGRAKRLGFGDVRTVGDLKFSVPLPKAEADLRIEGKRKVILWASTHEGEERLAESVHSELVGKYPELLTVIAPRHVGRVKEMVFSLPFALRSETRTVGRNVQVYLIDTVGELPSLYRFCDVAVIGGSFFEGVGGHNPVEAVLWRKPVIIGSYHEDFSEIIRELEIPSVSREKVGELLLRLLSDEGIREEVAIRSYINLMERRNVADKVIEEVLS